MLGVIEMLDYDTVNAAHRKVLWTALFVLTTIRVENCLDITLPARKLAAYCEQLIK